MSKQIGYGQRRLIKEIIENTWDTKNPDGMQFNLNDILYIIQEMQDDEGKRYLTEKRSVSGHHVFRKLAEHLLYRNLANYDSMVLMTAEKGVGKSSAAIMLARYWCNLLGIRFNPARHLAYSNKDVMEKIDMLNKFEPLVCLTGTSKIKIRCEDGTIKMVNINTLVGRDDFEVLSYNNDSDRFEFIKPEKCIKTHDSAEVFEVELENGRTLRATKDHLFLTRRGYVRLVDLTDEDEIVMESTKCQCGKEFIPHREYSVCCSPKCGYKRQLTRQRGNKHRLKYMRKYRKANKERLKKIHQYKFKQNPEYYRELKRQNNKKHKERIQKYNQKYQQEHREQINKNHREWIKRNHKHVRAYYNKRHKVLMKTNPEYKIKRNLRRRIGLALKDQGMMKDKSLPDYIGCSVHHLKKHLSEQFVDGMCWSNYGEWHVDHIVPCDAFDLISEEEQKKCFNYKNLQPLWEPDNLSKGASI